MCEVQLQGFTKQCTGESTPQCSFPEKRSSVIPLTFHLCDLWLNNRNSPSGTQSY